MTRQCTLNKTYTFEGKGLHSGRYAHVKLLPAPVDTGIVFIRTDLDGAKVPALGEYVSSTSRSTTISLGKAYVGTIEHLKNSAMRTPRQAPTYASSLRTKLPCR